MRKTIPFIIIICILTFQSKAQRFSDLVGTVPSFGMADLASIQQNQLHNPASPVFVLKGYESNAPLPFYSNTEKQDIYNDITGDWFNNDRLLGEITKLVVTERGKVTGYRKCATTTCEIGSATLINDGPSKYKTTLEERYRTYKLTIEKIGENDLLVNVVYKKTGKLNGEGYMERFTRRAAIKIATSSDSKLESDEFNGNWYNENAGKNEIQNLIITNWDQIKVIQNCTSRPTGCDFGTSVITPYGTGKYTARYKDDNKEFQIIIEKNNTSELQVQITQRVGVSFKKYNGKFVLRSGAPRANQPATQEAQVSSADQNVVQTATVVRRERVDYTGNWVNSNANTQTIKKLVVTNNQVTGYKKCDVAAGCSIGTASLVADVDSKMKAVLTSEELTATVTMEKTGQGTMSVRVVEKLAGSTRSRAYSEKFVLTQSAVIRK